MNLYIKGKDLHHAYCIVGNNTEIVKELHNFLVKELKFSIHGNPDFSYGEYDVLDIEDSRALKELHQNRPTTGDKKIFVVNANFITEKAQNAMLKIFEEPRGDTHFFLILPSANGLLSTLASRLMIIDSSRQDLDVYGKNNSIINAKDFLKMNMAGRLDAIKKLMEEITDEEKSKIEAVKFLNSLEMEMFPRKSALSPRLSASLEQIEKIRQYSSEQSPSLKMLLEYLALVIPAL